MRQAKTGARVPARIQRGSSVNTILNLTRWLLVAVALAGALFVTIRQPDPDIRVDVVGHVDRVDGHVATSYVVG